MLKEWSDRVPPDPVRDRRQARIVGVLSMVVGAAIIGGLVAQVRSIFG